jgi:hypothetical protein
MYLHRTREDLLDGNNVFPHHLIEICNSVSFTARQKEETKKVFV